MTHSIKQLFKVIILPAILLSSFTLYAQEEKPYREPGGLNNWYFELGGAGLFYSLNYEKVLAKSTKWGWTGRVGIGYNPKSYTFLNKITLEDNTVMVPFTTSVLYGSRKERLEAGGGFTLVNTGITERKLAYTAILGFRVIETNRVFFRVAYTPVIMDGAYINWYGVSLGLNFGLK